MGLWGDEAVGSRGGNGPYAGATLPIVMEPESVGLCVRMERTWRPWADGGRLVAQLAPLEPPRILGWRRPGEGNLAFGGMNEELWKRLPTPPGERIGRRARLCVLVCLGSGAARVLGAAARPPRRGPGAHVARPPSARGRPAGLERRVWTEAWGSGAGCRQLDVRASSREVREGGGKAWGWDSLLRPPVSGSPRPFAAFTLGELMARSSGE